MVINLKRRRKTFDSEFDKLKKLAEKGKIDDKFHNLDSKINFFLYGKQAEKVLGADYKSKRAEYAALQHSLSMGDIRSGNGSNYSRGVEISPNIGDLTDERVDFPEEDLEILDPELSNLELTLRKV